MTPYEEIMEKLKAIQHGVNLIWRNSDQPVNLILRAEQNIEKSQTYIIVLIGIAAAILLLGIWRAVKQRKIEKMLKQLLEEKDRSE